MKHIGDPLREGSRGGSQTRGCAEPGGFVSQRTGILYLNTLGDGGLWLGC